MAADGRPQGCLACGILFKIILGLHLEVMASLLVAFMLYSCWLKLSSRKIDRAAAPAAKRAVEICDLDRIIPRVADVVLHARTWWVLLWLALHFK
jgi:hypothetical protein